MEADSKWLFPIRMENSKSIEWVDNIVCALSKFNAPITQSIWDTCLRTGRIAAKTTEENNLLRQWWTQGWKETPVLPQSGVQSTPVLQISTAALGETLELVYPSLNCFERTHKIPNEQAMRIILGAPHIISKHCTYVLLRETHCAQKYEKEPYRWIVFTPNNEVAGTFKTKVQVANFLGCTRKQVDVVCATKDHKFFSGYWLWKVDWGFNPIDPKGNKLPPSWRKQCSQN